MIPPYVVPVVLAGGAAAALYFLVTPKSSTAKTTASSGAFPAELQPYYQKLITSPSAVPEAIDVVASKLNAYGYTQEAQGLSIRASQLRAQKGVAPAASAASAQSTILPTTNPNASNAIPNVAVQQQPNMNMTNPDAAGPAMSTPRYQVTTSSAAPAGDLVIYNKPNGTKIGGVDKNGVVPVFEVSSDGVWARVSWSGGRNPAASGWVHFAYLKPVATESSSFGRMIQREIVGRMKQREIVGRMKQREIVGRMKQREIVGSRAGSFVSGSAPQEIIGRMIQREIVGSRAGSFVSGSAPQEIIGRMIQREIVGSRAGFGGTAQQEIVGRMVQREIVGRMQQREIIGRTKQREIVGRMIQREIVGSRAGSFVSGSPTLIYGSAAFAPETVSTPDPSKFNPLAHLPGKASTGRMIAREIIGLATGAMTAQIAPGGLGIVRAPSGFRLRSQPSSHGKTLTVAPRGARLQVMQIVRGPKTEAKSPGQGGWARVSWRGQSGWAPLEWMSAA